jgi:acyl-[acyl carrier protein]--UDP-N-acetylglucosamine O-acyltransferase
MELQLGMGAVVAAGSVVTKNVQPYAIVGGNPAKLIKYRFPDDIIDEIESTQFWDMDIHEIQNFDIHTKNIHELIHQIKEYTLSQ